MVESIIAGIVCGFIGYAVGWSRGAYWAVTHPNDVVKALRGKKEQRNG